MRVRTKFLLIAVSLVAFLFATFYLFFILRGRALLTAKLKELTHRNVTVGALDIAPLFRVRVKGLFVEGLFKAEQITFTPSVIGFAAGKLAFYDITAVRPEFTYEKKAAGQGGKPLTVSPSFDLKNLIVKRLHIRDGRFNFIDHTAGEQGIRLTVKDIQFTLNNSYLFPASLLCKFALKGRIPWQEGQQEGAIEADGWIDPIKKDMQAKLKINDIDGIYLYPYYSGWIDLEKTRIQKAKLNFTSLIQGLDNNVTAQCRLELTDIERAPKPADAQEDKAGKIASAVLDFFRAMNQGKIVLDFTIRTKMDRPEFGLGNIRSAVKDKITEARKGRGNAVTTVLLVPARILESTVRGLADISRAVLDGSFAVGNEFKKAVEASFEKTSRNE